MPWSSRPSRSGAGFSATPQSRDAALRAASGPALCSLEVGDPPVESRRRPPAVAAHRRGGSARSLARSGARRARCSAHRPRSAMLQLRAGRRRCRRRGWPATGRRSRAPRTSGRPRTGTSPSARRTWRARHGRSGGSARPAARRAAAGSARTCRRDGARRGRDRGRSRRRCGGHAPSARIAGNRGRPARAPQLRQCARRPRRLLAGLGLDRAGDHAARHRLADAFDA